MELLPGQTWLAAKLPVAQWPADAPRRALAAPHGDRRTELGLVGMDADVAAVRRALRRALVTKAEFERGVWGRHEGRYWWLIGARAHATAVDSGEKVAAGVAGKAGRDEAKGKGVACMAGRDEAVKPGTVHRVHSSAEFEALVKGARGKQLLVVDFAATWCGPCKQMAPKVKAMAAAMPHAKFMHVDVDECEEVAQQYGVAAMPTFKLLRGGKEVDSLQGADEAALREKVERLAGKPSRSGRE